MNTAVAYLRVSTEEQVEKYGLDAQREGIQEVAKEKGYKLVAEYIDAGISGTKDEDDRPGLWELLAAAERGEFSLVLAYDSSRIARDQHVKGYVIHNLKRAGVAVEYAKGNGDNTPEGKLQEMILDAFDVYLRLDILRRTKAGRDARGKQDGEKGGRVPMGYKRIFKDGKATGEIELDCERADMVRFIFSLRSQGDTLAQIADTLNNNGETTPRGGTWHASSVREILLNEDKYRGGYRGDSQESWPVLLEE